MKIKDIIEKVGEDNIRKAVESDDADALKNLMEAEGVALDDEQLDYIAGGVRIRKKPIRRLRRNTTTSTNGGGSGSGDSDDPNSPNWTAPEEEDPDVTDPC